MHRLFSPRNLLVHIALLVIILGVAWPAPATLAEGLAQTEDPPVVTDPPAEEDTPSLTYPEVMAFQPAANATQLSDFAPAGTEIVSPAQDGSGFPAVCTYQVQGTNNNPFPGFEYQAVGANKLESGMFDDLMFTVPLNLLAGISELPVYAKANGFETSGSLTLGSCDVTGSGSCAAVSENGFTFTFLGARPVADDAVEMTLRVQNDNDATLNKVVVGIPDLYPHNPIFEQTSPACTGPARAQVPGPGNHGIAKFRGGQVAVVTEGETFTEDVDLEFVPLYTAPKNGMLADGPLPMMQFSIEPYHRGNGQVQNLHRPARLVIDLRAELANWGDINSAYGEFYLAYRETADDEWQTVPVTEYETGLFAAEVNHFSEWQAGMTPSGWTPTWSPPSVSEFSAAVNYGYPLSVPAGRGGVNPSLSLAYSSRSLDGAIHHIDDGTVAPGWSMADIKIIRDGFKYDYNLPSDDPRAIHPNKFRLILNGTGYDLSPKFPDSTDSHAVMRYYVKGNSAVRVARYFDPTNAENQDGIYWQVETGDGLNYRLGFTADAESYQTAANFYMELGYKAHPGAIDSLHGIGWSVDTVTDPMGNVMTYHYNTDQIGQTMSDYQWIDGNYQQTWVNFVIQKNRIAEIRYNYKNIVNPTTWLTDGHPDGSNPAATRILLAQSDASKSPISNINRVLVFHGADSNPIREYRLNMGDIIYTNQGCEYRDGSLRQTITGVVNSIQEWAGTDATPYTDDPGYALPATTFTYVEKEHAHDTSPPTATCFSYPYLASYENGYGGKVSFNYASDERAVSHYEPISGTVYYQFPDMGYSYYVTEMIVEDGINPSKKTTYTGSEPCYNQGNNTAADNDNWGEWGVNGADICITGDHNEFGPFTGFERMETRSYDFDQQTGLNMRVTEFHTDTLKHGRVAWQASYSGIVATSNMLQSESYTSYVSWDTDTEAGHDYVTVQTVTSTLYELDENNNPVALTKVMTYGYDTDLQVGSTIQFGNQTAVFDQGFVNDPNDDRTIITCYAVNTGDWLVSHPVANRVFEGVIDGATITDGSLCDYTYQPGANDPVMLSGSYTFYDDQAYQVPPTQGLLTKSTVGFKGAALPAGQEFITTSQISYDVYGNPASALDAAGEATTIHYDPEYNLYPLQVVNTLGQDSTAEIIGFKNISQSLVTADDLEGARQYAGLTRSMSSANGSSVLYEYDPFGRLWASYVGSATTAPDNGVATDRDDGHPVEKYRYWDNSWNNGSVQRLDPANADPFLIAIQSYPHDYSSTESMHGYQLYDGLGRVIQSNKPWTNVAPQNFGNYSESQQDVLVKTSYDALGQSFCTTTAYTRPLTAWPNSPFDNSKTCTDSSLAPTITSFDSRGRATVMTYPNGTTAETSYKVKTMSFDNWGSADYHMTQVKDANGNVTNTFTNLRGQVAAVREIEQTTLDSYAHYVDTFYSYDPLGNLTGVKSDDVDPNTPSPLREIRITYDNLGNKTDMIDPDMGTWEYEYDLMGNLVEQLDDNGNLICFHYDELNRMTEKALAVDFLGNLYCPTEGTTSWSGGLLAKYTYDTAAYGEGQVHTVEWGSNDKDTFDYDGYGRVMTQTRTLAGNDFALSTTAYDAAQRPITMQYPDGQYIHIGYDQEGAESLSLGTSSSATTPLITNVGYNERGQMTHLMREGSAIDTHYTYRTASGNFRLSNIYHGAVNNGVSNFGLYYDNVGNITRIIEVTGFLVSQYQDFEYDSFDQLVSARTNYNNANLSEYNRQYEYDPIGNLIERRAYDQNDNLLDSYTFDYNGVSGKPDAVDEMSINGSATAAFVYDDNGNMISRGSADGTVYTQAFDEENRLTAVSDTTTGLVTYFTYDHSGQRTSTILPEDNITIYTPFPGYEEEVKTCAVKGCSGYTIKRSTYSIAGQMSVQRITGDPISSNNGIYFFHSDHLGSATAMTDQNGNVVPGSIARYLPYGEERTSPTTALSDFGFTGHKENRDLGLTYANFRYYIPELGRFNKADTVVPDPGKAVGYNRYAYVNNNPIRFNDPTGHVLDEGNGSNGSSGGGSDEQMQLARHMSDKYGIDFIRALGKNWGLNLQQVLYGDTSIDGFVRYETVDFEGSAVTLDGINIFEYAVVTEVTANTVTTSSFLGTTLKTGVGVSYVGGLVKGDQTAFNDMVIHMTSYNNALVGINQGRRERTQNVINGGIDTLEIGLNVVDILNIELDTSDFLGAGQDLGNAVVNVLMVQEDINIKRSDRNNAYGNITNQLNNMHVNREPYATWSGQANISINNCFSCDRYESALISR